jgi:hypothetical protein
LVSIGGRFERFVGLHRNVDDFGQQRRARSQPKATRMPGKGASFKSKLGPMPAFWLFD